MIAIGSSMVVVDAQVNLRDGLPGASASRMVTAMDEGMTALVLRMIERMPQWIRHDLAAKDESTRQRAEETLAAMIGDALAKDAEAPQPTSD